MDIVPLTATTMSRVPPSSALHVGYQYENGETIPGQKKEEAIALESAPSSVQTSPEKTHTTLPDVTIVT